MTKSRRACERYETLMAEICTADQTVVPTLKKLIHWAEIYENSTTTVKVTIIFMFQVNNVSTN